MNRPELYKSSISIAVLLLLLPICPVSAVEPSPAGGGWLEVAKPGGYAFVEDHDDFDANLTEEFTIELWIYLNRPPKFRESWILLHKEGSYLLILSGYNLVDGSMKPLGKDQIFNMTSYYYLRPGDGIQSSSRNYTQEVIPLNQWHHLAFVKNPSEHVLFINGRQHGFPSPVRGPLGNANFPFYLGGTGGILPPDGRGEVKWVPFTGGLIDEVRISNIARYPVAQFEVDIPRHRLEPDEHTLALWHFDGSRAEWLSDASGKGHTLTGFDLAYYGVESAGKLPTLWGRMKSG